MNDIKPNDILVNGAGELTVIAIHGNCVWVENETTSYLDKIIDMEKAGWTKKKTPWVPKINMVYFVASITSPALVYCVAWDNQDYDLHRLALGLVFETEAEAVAKSNEIIKLMGK